MIADVYTLDTTYQLQLRHPDGAWNWVSQAEYTSREDVQAEVAVMYGGVFNEPGRYRIVRHERHIEE